MWSLPMDEDDDERSRRFAAPENEAPAAVPVSAVLARSEHVAVTLTGVQVFSTLPPDGPLRLVVRCDQLGLAETVTELDGTAIRAAAADVVPLWPWISPRSVEQPEPPAPELPAGSWFARG